MDEPLVSIIIPIYNSEKYLSACIQSCIGQSYRNIEIILVDDGSQDSSFLIAQKYAMKDSRIQVVHQNNAGVSAARNTGLKRAKGDYISFLDSDDELYLNAIEFLVGDIQTYDADIVSAVIGKVNSNGQEYCRYSDGKINIYTQYEPLILSLKYDRQTNSACAKIFSKDILENIFFVEGRNINEDGYFLFQCYTKKPKLVQHNVCVYKYYAREDSSTRGKFSEKYFDMLYFSDLKIQYIKENLPFLIELARDMEVSTHLFFLEVLCRDVHSKYKEYEKHSLEIVRKRYFKYRPINKHEQRMARIVAWGLYPIYKQLFIIRLGKKLVVL